MHAYWARSMFLVSFWKFEAHFLSPAPPFVIFGIFNCSGMYSRTRISVSKFHCVRLGFGSDALCLVASDIQRASRFLNAIARKRFLSGGDEYSLHFMTWGMPRISPWGVTYDKTPFDSFPERDMQRFCQEYTNAVEGMDVSSES